MSFLLSTLSQLLAVAPVTIGLFILSLGFGAVLACLLVWGRLKGPRPLKALIRFYVFVFRGTPLLIQLFLIYYGLDQFNFIQNSPLGLMLQSPFYTAVFSIALCTAAYQSEILRGGLRAVPYGEVEAGIACGFTNFQLLYRIIAPITLRQALPAYSTEAIMVIKSTALASLVSVVEMTGEAQQIMLSSYRTYEVFLAAAVIYLVLAYLVAQIFKFFERCVSPQLFMQGQGSK